MNFQLSNFSLPLVAALAICAGCRSTETLGQPLPPAAGMAAAAGARAGTGGASAGTSATAGSAAGAGGGTAVATLTGFGSTPETVKGTATFAKATGTDVKVTVEISNCTDGKEYPVHIHEGTSCADAMAQGDHWGPARGEGIPSVKCMGTTGKSELTRPATPTNLAWTIGGDTATNVVGHAFVVHQPDVPSMPPRIACGVITAK